MLPFITFYGNPCTIEPKYPHFSNINSAVSVMVTSCTSLSPFCRTYILKMYLQPDEIKHLNLQAHTVQYPLPNLVLAPSLNSSKKNTMFSK